MKLCHSCKKSLDPGREIGRKDECPFCRADLHCCLNCRFFERSAPKHCREPQADLVSDKQKANFCDYFVFADRAEIAAGSADEEKARRSLEDLFRK
jgi:hypothetical protein